MAALRERVEQERGDRGAVATPIILSRKALSEYLGVSDRTVDALVAAGDLPPPRRGSAGGKRWIREEVEQAVHRWPVAGEEARH